jgi:hypothetical protein
MSITNTENLTVIESAMVSINFKPCWVIALDDVSGVNPDIAISNDDEGRAIPFTTATRAEVDKEIAEDKTDLPECFFRPMLVSFDNHIINVLNVDGGSINHSYDWTVGRI